MLNEGKKKKILKHSGLEMVYFDNEVRELNFINITKLKD